MKCQIPQIAWHEREPVLSIDFQPVKGNRFRLASGGSDKLVLIWYVTYHDGKGIHITFHSEYDRHLKPVNIVRFAPTGNLLASGDDDGALILWKLKEHENEDDEKWFPFKLLSSRSKDIFDISWSADGNYLISASTENKAVMWDMQNFQILNVFSDAKGYVQGVSWDPLNKYMASLSADRSLRIMSVKSQRTVHKIRYTPRPVGSDKSTARVHLFHDDTLKSYFRRLSFTPDGELLIVPSGILIKDEKSINTTYIFSRHSLTEPVAHLPSGDKYTVAVRCNPLLYKLRGSEDKENRKSLINLPYRMVFAVATSDSVLVYDTEQLVPLACISNIHYTHLTDLAWSIDGRILIASSTDGYCSFITFSEEELGDVYEPPPPDSPKTEDLAKDIHPISITLDDALKKPIVEAKLNDSLTKPDVVLTNINSETPTIPDNKCEVSPKTVLSPIPVKPKKPKLTIESFFKSPKMDTQIEKQEIHTLKEEPVLSESKKTIINDKEAQLKDQLSDKNIEFKVPISNSTPIRGSEIDKTNIPRDIVGASNDSDSVEVIFESKASQKDPKCKVQLDFTNKIGNDSVSKKVSEIDISDVNAVDLFQEKTENVLMKTDNDWKLELSLDESIAPTPMDISEPGPSKLEHEKKPVEKETTPKPKRRVNFITLSKTVSSTPPKM